MVILNINKDGSIRLEASKEGTGNVSITVHNASSRNVTFNSNSTLEHSDEFRPTQATISNSEPANNNKNRRNQTTNCLRVPVVSSDEPAQQLVTGV